MRKRYISVVGLYILKMVRHNYVQCIAHDGDENDNDNLIEVSSTSYHEA
jgi:hypothetical protein